jgi:hypothetical protein
MKLQDGFFYVSLNMHLSITSSNDELNAQIFNTIVTILYMYMHLYTGRSLTDSDNTICCINTICHPEDEQDIARNMYMYRIVINVLKLFASNWSLAKVIRRMLNNCRRHKEL